MEMLGRTPRLQSSLREAFAIAPHRSHTRLLSVLEAFRNIFFLYCVLRWIRKGFYQVRGHGLVGTVVASYRKLRSTLFGLFLRLPGVKTRVQAQVADSIRKIEHKLVPRGPGVERYLQLPKEGWSEERVRSELQKLSEMEHTRWEDGRVSGAVYHGGADMVALQADAFSNFAMANPIHPDVFPGVRKMEAEIVSMVLNLFHAPEQAAGVTTSGGTESILMACLGARQKGLVERGITEPEMIIPETAHAAFRKAGMYFGIKCHLAPCRPPHYKVHINSVAKLINPNTVLLVGSAPNFPHGIIDDIAALSRIAVRRSLPLHVDCCLGSFLLPFLEKAGFPYEPFDFRLKGVTSISCDTHKYGFAPKGNSTILYRSEKLRQYQYYILPDWPGGVYASPSIAGSRPGALIAGCWASMVQTGDDGYIAACHQIVGATKKIEADIREHPVLSEALFVIGRPLVSVIAFSSNTLPIYDIADAMSTRGWHLNALQSPAAIHVAVTLPIVSALDSLLQDLISVVEEQREKQVVNDAGAQKNDAAMGDAAALYGVAGRLPNKVVVEDLARGFLDILYQA